MTMLRNTLTFRGKIKEALSRCKTIFLYFVNIKKKIILYKIWANITAPNKNSVIIIANGPSFNKEIAASIISKRKYFHVFTMNSYCLDSISKKLIPDYYLLSDPANFETENESIKVDNNALKKYIKNSAIKFISPYGAKWKFYKKPYLEFNDSQNLSSNNIDPRKPRGYRSNTGFKAIALALALGYNKVFMVGFDFDYPRKITINKSNKIFLKNKHSHSEQNIDASEYFDSVAHAMHWWAQDYWHLKKLSSSKVVNITKNSMIDVFPRMNPKSFIRYIQNMD